MPLKYLFDPGAKTSKRVRASKKEELRLAEEVSGKRLPRSGGVSWGYHAKETTQGGDVVGDKVLIEHKMTVLPYMRVLRLWFEKLEQGAERMTKVPVLVLTWSKPGQDNVDQCLLRVEDAKRLQSQMATELAFLSFDKVESEQVNRLSIRLAAVDPIRVYRWQWKDGFGVIRRSHWILLPYKQVLPALRSEAP